MPTGKNRKFLTLAFLLLISAALAACSSLTPANALPPTVAATAPATVTPVPSQAAAPTATPIETSQPVVCTQKKGHFLEITLPTKLLKYPLEAKVYLPPCYDPLGDQKYPVLYMLHGMTSTDDQWVRLGMTDTADQLISAGLIQPMIIVMPYEINWQLAPEDSNFGKAITDLLIPYVEKTYNVCTERKCRAIGGLSRGGNWAVQIGFEHWQMFTAIGAHSTPLFYGELTQVALEVKAMPSPADAPEVYVDAGKKDPNLSQVEEFEKLLNTLNVDHTYQINGGYHDEAYWSGHVEEYLIWYAMQLEQ